MARGDAIIMFAPEGTCDMPQRCPATSGNLIPMHIHIYCEDTDKLYNQAITHGATSKLEPHDAFWGDKYCQISDINGYVWSLGTHQNKS